MSSIKTILTELIGLFVDDGVFALSIVAWIGLAGLLAPRLGLPGAASAALLFLGLAALLAASALRAARR